MRLTLLSFILLLSACTAPELPLPDDLATQLASRTIVDLSYPYNAETVYWPTAAGFEKVTDFEGITDNGFYYTAYSFKTAEHGGTHLDAPVHFAEGMHTADQIPLSSLMGAAVVVDVSEDALADPDYLISVADVEAFEAQHGAIPADAIVLFRTGYGQFWPDREAYMGTAERGPEAVAKLHFPGIHPETAAWLLANRDIKAVGIDTPSIDRGQSVLFETHQTLFAQNIPAFENVANLDAVPETGATVVALPMKIEGGSGGPLRMVAFLPLPPLTP